MKLKNNVPHKSSAPVLSRALPSHPRPMTAAPAAHGRSTLLAGIIALALSFPAAASAQILLVDFGNNGTNGNITPSPTSGVYWNNSFTGSFTITDMVTTTNVPTTFDLSFTTAVGTNSAALGVGGAPAPFNVVTAYEDAIFTTGTTAGTGITLRLSQLDATKTYRFTLFGSRSATDSRTTNFQVSGATTASGSLQTSGTDLGGAGINYNNSNSLVLGGASGIAANGSDQIDITFFASAADTNKFGYLNAMQVEVIPEPATWALLAGALCLLVIFRRRARA